VDSLGTDFDALLTRVALWVLGATACWALLVVAAVALEARTQGRVRILASAGCPPAVRMWLLGLFVALFAGLSPAQASDTGAGGTGAVAGALDGLALPDRTVDAAPRQSPVTARQVVVRPGDSLWLIVRGGLPPGSADSRIAAGVAAVHAANRRTIGPDPDALRPGQRLDLTPLLALTDRTTISEAP
jgi:hypothetical protein